MNSPPERTPRTRCVLALVAVAIVFALAGILRTGTLDESLWIDELHTSWVVADGAGEIPARAALGNQSPLYFYLPWAATRLATPTERALRFPSLLAGLLVVPAMLGVVTIWTHKPLAGLVAAWLAAVDFDFAWYSQEARVYSLVLLLSLLHLAICWRLLAAWAKPTAATRSAAVILAIVLFYLHYTTVLLFAGELIAYGLLSTQRQWRPAYRPAQLALDGALVALACSPTAVHLSAISAARDNWRTVVEPISWSRALLVFPLAPLAMGLITLVIVFLGQRQMARLGLVAAPTRLAIEPRVVILLSTAFLAPVLIAWAATEFAGTPLLLKRYVLGAALIPPLAAGVFVAASPSSFVRIIVAAAVVVVATLQSGPLANWVAFGKSAPHAHEDWRRAVQRIAEVDNQGRYPVLVRSGFIEADDRFDSAVAIEREYCLAPVRGVYRLGPPRLLIPLPTWNVRLSDESLATIRARGGAWLITRSPARNARRQAERIASFLSRPEQPWRVAAVDDYQNVTVVWIVADAPPRLALE